MVKRETNPNIFSALISSIISQQISTKAATTVRSRFIELVGEITPENIYNSDLDSIQNCGMTLRKANYIKEAAKSILDEKIDLDRLHNLTDAEIIKELTKFKGVGEWTAEMLLIHSFQRPNILSYKDLGIRRGLARLYGLEDMSKEEFEIYRERYAPYCTVASIYLWEISAMA